jgi:hypothetical protein
MLDQLNLIVWVPLSLFLLAIGALAHATWQESRHDCLPHSPDRCRYKEPS